MRLAVSGHEHNYERSRPADGVTYVVTGGGGQTLYDDLQRRQDWSVTRALTHEFLLADFTMSSASVRAIGEDGQTLDSFSL